MKSRALGASGIDTSVVGFGAWAIGGWQWGGTDREAAIDAIRKAIDCGITLIDTAPVYGFGTSEELVGEAIRGRRDEVVIATKCGLVWNRTDGEFFFSADDAPEDENGSTHRDVHRFLGPESIRHEVEQSLRRLGAERIDLYQTHWQDSTTPIADTMGELERLRSEGKIGAIGCSNATKEQMDRYRAGGSLDADQEQYSMLNREAEEMSLPYCEQNGMAFLAYSPIAQGLLTGKITPERTFPEGDQRSRGDRWGVENRTAVAAFLEEIRPIADGHDASLAQTVIAWTLRQPGCSHVLVGARRPDQAAENARAGEIELADDELGTIDSALERHGPKMI